MKKVARPSSEYGGRSMRSLKSFRSKKTSVGALSQAASSVAFSAISQVPVVDPIVMMNMCWELLQLRSKLVVKAQQQKISLREILTSTQLLKLLQTVGYKMKIANLKAVLKELGFNWNGASCSLT